MLDEGVRAALDHLGIDLRTVAYGEWEAPAASQLVALMEAGALEPAPVWCGDFRRIDAAAFRGTVDAVVAGFPCQDLSVAGRRAGLNGKRSGLFFSVVDFADACGAWLLVLENVGGIASATASVVDEEEGELEERAASRVLGELADRGWNAEWITLPASDVGASHGRERWFCLAWRVAHPARDGRDGSHGEARRRRGVREAGVILDDAGVFLPGQALHTRRGQKGGGEAGTGGASRGLADTKPAGRRSAQGADQAGQSGVGEQGGTRRGECGGPAVGRPEFFDGGVGLAHATEHGRHEGRPESGWEQGRPDAAICGCAVANANGGGPARICRRREGGTAERLDELANAGGARLPRGGGKQ